MGRTNSTYRNHLDTFFERFKTYRKGLRQESQQAYDRLKEKAHGHAHAASYLNSGRPQLPAFLSMLVGIQKETQRNSDEVERLEVEVEELKTQLEILETKAFEESSGVQG
jgi:hypothetical protein